MADIIDYIEDVENSREKCLAVIDKISSGVIERDALESSDISRRLFLRLVNKDAFLKEQYEEALAIFYDILSEVLIDKKRWHEFGIKDVKEAQVWSKNMQYFLTKRSPQKYGDKIVIDRQTSTEVLIFNRLEEAKQRMINEVRKAEIIDNTPILLIED